MGTCWIWLLASWISLDTATLIYHPKAGAHIPTGQSFRPGGSANSALGISISVTIGKVMPFRCWLLEVSIMGWKRPVQRQRYLRKRSLSACSVSDPEHRSHADGVRSLWDSKNTAHNLINDTPVRLVGVANDMCLLKRLFAISPPFH